MLRYRDALSPGLARNPPVRLPDLPRAPRRAFWASVARDPDWPPAAPAPSRQQAEAETARPTVCRWRCWLASGARHPKRRRFAQAAGGERVLASANLAGRVGFGLVLMVALGATVAAAKPPAAIKASSFEVLVRWAPLLLWGFGFNILISIMAMGIGTVAGVPVGIAQLSRLRPVRIASSAVTQLFRNSPWLVLLFLCVFLLPFEIRAFGLRVPFPDWAKATMGFALPVMANTSEITRGAIQSVPTGQWDSARALGLTRRQCLYLVILPQCVKRMLPPWMNLYSLIAMSTVNASIVGVSEMITLTAQVHAAEGSRPELLAPLYAFALVCFFIYCYPIGKWTQALERRYQVAW